MPEANEKTFTEKEHLAILADRVQSETAELSAERDSLKTSVDELQNKIDVLEGEKAAALTRAEKAEADFEEFKNGLEQLREAAERKDQRVAQVKEVAAHLGEDFFANEERIARITAMSDEAFDGYVEDLRATAPAGEQPTAVVPRETAMNGKPAEQPADKSAASTLLLGRFQGGN